MNDIISFRRDSCILHPRVKINSLENSIDNLIDPYSSLSLSSVFITKITHPRFENLAVFDNRLDFREHNYSRPFC